VKKSGRKKAIGLGQDECERSCRKKRLGGEAKINGAAYRGWVTVRAKNRKQKQGNGEEEVEDWGGKNVEIEGLSDSYGGRGKSYKTKNSYAGKRGIPRQE